MAFESNRRSPSERSIDVAILRPLKALKYSLNVDGSLCE
jgi:hypothetical protein